MLSTPEQQPQHAEDLLDKAAAVAVAPLSPGAASTVPGSPTTDDGKDGDSPAADAVPDVCAAPKVPDSAPAAASLPSAVDSGAACTTSVASQAAVAESAVEHAENVDAPQHSGVPDLTTAESSLAPEPTDASGAPSAHEDISKDEAGAVPADFSELAAQPLQLSEEREAEPQPSAHPPSEPAAEPAAVDDCEDQLKSTETPAKAIEEPSESAEREGPPLTAAAEPTDELKPQQPLEDDHVSDEAPVAPVTVFAEPDTVEVVPEDLTETGGKLAVAESYADPNRSASLNEEIPLSDDEPIKEESAEATQAATAELTETATPEESGDASSAAETAEAAAVAEDRGDSKEAANAQRGSSVEEQLDTDKMKMDSVERKKEEDKEEKILGSCREMDRASLADLSISSANMAIARAEAAKAVAAADYSSQDEGSQSFTGSLSPQRTSEVIIGSDGKKRVLKKKAKAPKPTVFESRPRPSVADCGTLQPVFAPLSARTVFENAPSPSRANAGTLKPAEPKSVEKTVFESSAKPSSAHAGTVLPHRAVADLSKTVFENAPKPSQAVAGTHVQTQIQRNEAKTIFEKPPAESKAHASWRETKTTEQTRTEFMNQPQQRPGVMRWDSAAPQPSVRIVFENRPKATTAHASALKPAEPESEYSYETVSEDECAEKGDGE